MVRKIKIKDFTDVVTGGTPSTRKREFWENGKIPWLNSGDLNQEIIYKASNYITQIGLKNSAAKLMPSDSVTIALTGATTGVVGYLTFEACANQSVTGILPSQNHFSKYLYYYLKSIRKKVINDSYGGAQPHISQGYVKEIIVPLPPLPKQKRIATILDKADALRQKNKQLLAAYDELLQATFLDMFGDPVVNPKGWEKKKLSTICIFKGGGTPSKSRPEYFEGDIPWVTPKDMKIDFITDSQDKITKDAVNNSSASLIPSNSILIVVRSGILKSKLPISINKIDVTLNQDMKALLLNKNHNEIFIMFSLRALSPFLLKKVRGTTADNINSEDLKKLGIPIPPLLLQNQFAKIVENIEAQKALLIKCMQESEDLFNGLVQKAFKGEL